MSRQFVLTLLVALGVGGCDLGSKRWAIEAAASGPRPLVHGLLDLVHWENPGIAFSLLRHGPHGLRVALLSLMAATVAVVGLLTVARRRVGLLASGGIGLVVGGAVGNLVDRLDHGTVTDFLHLHRGAFDWPAFNVADVAISVGAALLVLASFRTRRTA